MESAPKIQFARAWLTSTFPAETAAFFEGFIIELLSVDISTGSRIPEFRGISSLIKHLKT